MKRPESPFVARIALAVPAVIGLSIPFALCVMSYLDTNFLIHTAHIADGSIVKKHCQNHGEVVYSYVVNGKLYSGRGSAGDCGSATCKDTRIGEPVQVMYSSQKPQISACMAPGADLDAKIQDEKRGIFTNFISLAIISFLIFVMIFDLTKTSYGKDQELASGEN